MKHPTGPPTSLVVSVCDGRGRALRRPALRIWLTATTPRRFAGDVTIALVSDAQSRRLNRTHRRVDRATDVLAFPAETGWRDGRWRPRRAREARPGVLGDIVIATGVAARQAREQGHPLATELRILALHGLLHLVGYDHERNAAGMAAIERRLRRAGGLERGLIERGGDA